MRVVPALAAGCLAGSLLASGPAVAFEGRYRAGTPDYDQDMTIKRGGGGFSARLSVSTRGCVGRVEGRGRLAGDILVVTARNDFGECRLDLKRAGRAVVVDEKECLTFHGSACAFSGSYEPVKDARP